jgi:hypothetical protein
MSNKIFKALLTEKIENFKLSFSKTAKAIFYDEEKNRLFHSLEYGMYRETLCKDFLKFVIPSRLELDDGFLISPLDNNISTQCDIVIFDSTHTPLYESGKKQRFFPVETIASIGEVKSNLSKQQLKEAINKLARIKKMRRDSQDGTVVSRKTTENFDNYKHPYDQIVTFIICNSLEFDSKNLVAEFKELYDSDIETRDRHNIILSINDGIFLYKHIVNEETLVWSYPYSQDKILKNRFLAPGENGNTHIETFANYIYMATNSATIFLPNFTRYSGKYIEGIYTDEN